ncbi:MAG: hypothetical protein U0795_16815 [Pirellulales bacterium]
MIEDLGRLFTRRRSGTPWLLGLALLVLAVSTSPAEAQRRTPMSQRQGSISPYMQLFGGNNRGVNSYFLFVRPQLHAERFMDQQMVRNNEFEQGIVGGPGQTRGQRLTLPQNDVVGGAIQQRPASAMQAAPRPAATFNFLDHYYPQAGPAQGNGTRVQQPLTR